MRRSVAARLGTARDARPGAARPGYVHRRRRASRVRSAGDGRHRGARLRRRPDRPGMLVRALGAGAVAVASRLPVYEEILADGELGWLFEPGEAQTLAAHLERLIDPHAAPRLAVVGGPSATGWPGTASRANWRTSTSSSPHGAMSTRRYPPAPAAAPAAADRRRPAHAHRPLLRLRDAGRGAAGRGPRPAAWRDRGHRSQRDLRGAGGAGEGGRDQGDRGRGGQDGRAGRGDRPVHRPRRSRAE